MELPTKLLLAVLTTTCCVHIVLTCSVQGMSPSIWWLDLEVVDTDRGEFLRRNTTDIDGILSASHTGEGLNAGPYFEASLENSEFTLKLNENFAQYEENETTQRMSIQVMFSCLNGQTLSHSFFLNVIDTNNNDPIFMALSDTINYTVSPPLPPGYKLTSLVNRLIVKDVDLTTQRIDFSIEENEYFEIVYDTSASPKTFDAVLSTTTFIRSLPEPITLRISATDVDQTGDPTRTTYANLRIEADDDFVFPEEPIFSQVFYLASFSSENEVLLQNPIYLIQGYDESVTFNITGEYAEYFTLVGKDILSVETASTLPAEVIRRDTILVELRASRQYTSGASATLVIKMPEARALSFERTNYTGQLEGNVLTHGTILLSTGYAADVTFNLVGEYQSFFSTDNNQNEVIISVSTPITDSVILNNNFLTLTLEAVGTNTLTATTNLVLEIIKEDANTPVFGNHIYYGELQEANGVSVENISLSQGYDDTVTFRLVGEHSLYFTYIQNGNDIMVSLKSNIPEDIIYNEKVLLFNILAEKPLTVGASATIGITFSSEVTEPSVMKFSKTNYVGSLENNEISLENIVLETGYTNNTVFKLTGEHVTYFSHINNGNVVTVSLDSPLPPQIIQNNKFVILELEADRERAIPTSTTILIELVTEDISVPVFSDAFYRGSYTAQGEFKFGQKITLQQGFDNTVRFELVGEHSKWFSLVVEENEVDVILNGSIPLEVVQIYNQLLFTIVANKAANIGGKSAISIDMPNELSAAVLRFAESSYVGSIENGTLQVEPITLLGEDHDNVNFTIYGEYNNYFTLERVDNTLSISLSNDLPAEAINDNTFILLDVEVFRADAISGFTTIVIKIMQELNTIELPIFDRAFYTGSYVQQELTLVYDIKLAQGYDESVQFILGDDPDAQWFSIAQNGNGLTLSITDVELSEVSNRTHLVFSVLANKPGTMPGGATIVISITDNPTNTIHFSKTYYTGAIQNQSLTLEEITIEEGYSEDVNVTLIGDYFEYFILSHENGAVAIKLRSDIPSELPETLNVLVLTLQARSISNVAFATLVIELVRNVDTKIKVLVFEEPHYSGSYLEIGGLTFDHEIRLIYYFNDNVTFTLEGAYNQTFSIQRSVDFVTISLINDLPSDVLLNNQFLLLTIVARKNDFLEGKAAIVISLNDEVTEAPTVTFSASSYQIRTDVSQTGLIGRVQATADNGERITYAVLTDNAHLQERLSVSEEGDLHLFAPANTGVYSFSVAATTLFTQVSASAMVQMTVDAIMVCDNDDRVLPPLIVLNRDEEEAHNNLVVLDGTKFAGCWYNLSNRWPLDQDWLFVDETGLHARAIDRENTSIAFMALSQVQVELILQCDNDNTTMSRTKRSLNNYLEGLGPYNYGNNKWVLTDTITYNSRRSLVNLIVNDINDNVPIFEGKQNEPIAVGYPVPQLLDVIMPRALVELKATDADIGENAALLYWSSASQLAVSPTSGTVHVRDNERSLEEGMTLVVQATDRNGAGNTGTIELVLRLLNLEHIAVITIRDAFLDEEETIINNITAAIGYDVKVLTAVVISDEYKTELAAERKKTRAEEARGASLQLYVYGLVQRNPVDVNKLTSDINSNIIASAVVAESVSFQDHLESREICDSGRDIGLLVTTIVLSVLLFIIILLIALWYYLKWKKDQNYNSFSDENSLASRTDTIDVLPKTDSLTRPRLDIDELKRSERRLQEMLNAPINNVTNEQTPSRITIPDESKIGVPVANTNIPIVIQTRDKLKTADESDDDDEFGEVKNKSGKKSVVTFNEIVEKIIHVDGRSDTPESSSIYETARL